MPKGGARSRSGPAADPNSLRSDRAGWTHLPAAGRDGDAPAWPLPRPTKFELEVWRDLWKKPQALMWERRGWEVQVALYVRTLRQASGAGARASTLTVLLRQEVNLGLTEDGLARNRWIIDEAPAAAAPPRRATSTAKDRIRLLQGGVDARAS
jgi:hypothetical protein